MKNLSTVISDPERAIAARYEIERCMLNWPDWQLVIEDRAVTELDRSRFEFSVDWGKLTFSWWDESGAESWRIIEYAVEKGEIIMLGTRGMGTERKLFRLRSPTLSRSHKPAGTADLREAREEYRSLLRQLIRSGYEGAGMERSIGGRTQTADGMTIPGAYARFPVKLRNQTALFIGACDSESKQLIDDIIAAGIVWLRGYNLRRPRNPATRLIFCLPQDRSRTVLERLVLVRNGLPGVRCEAVEIDQSAGTLLPVRPMAQLELLNKRPHELEWTDQDLLDNPWHGTLTRLAPELVEARIKPFTRRISYSINGLEFASVGGEEHEECTFGVAGTDEPGRSILTGRNLHRLEALVREIVTHRSPGATDRRHPYYRLRTEAWLEAKIRRDIHRLDASLDDRFVYSQIPAWRGDERSVIDLLAVTVEGRLAVIEIKAAEDMHLPLQGLDYWLRIEQARLSGELRRRKLFPGIEPADLSPLLFLVAPNLRFHRSFRLVAGCLDPAIEAFQIGINSSWREEVRVRSRIRVNGE